MTWRHRHILLRRPISLEIRTVDGKATALYRSTRAPWWIFTVEAGGLLGEVYGDSGAGERPISREPRDMRVGEIIEVDYEDGEPVQWRTYIARGSIRIIGMDAAVPADRRMDDEP